MTTAPLPEPPKRTGFPTVAGIMTIIAGIVNIGIGISALVALSAVSLFTIGIPAVLGAVIGVPLIIIGVVSVIGGVFAIQRRVWGLALTGAILALFPPPISLILGILAIIFISIGKKEFA